MPLDIFPLGTALLSPLTLVVALLLTFSQAEQEIQICNYVERGGSRLELSLGLRLLGSGLTEVRG